MSIRVINNGPTVDVIYACDKCGIKDKVVQVFERGETEDLAVWMKSVQVALSRDHDITSPHCHITELTYAKIPMAHGSARIGQADRH